MSEQLGLFEKKEEDDAYRAEFVLAKKEVASIRREIRYHANLYYNQDKPEISDFEYDKLMNRLKDLENKFPGLITKSSPTRKIIGNVGSSFEEVNHKVPMLSLTDVFSYDEVKEYVDKIEEEFGKNTEFVVETKIDGLSVSLDYKDGKLLIGSTRGDGINGEDVTASLLTLEDINETLTEKIDIEVRGEVYFPREQFEKINLELEALGKQPLANTRNAAAGTLRQLDTELVRSRGLSIFVFNVQNSSIKFKSHKASLDYCKKIGIKTIEYSKLAVGHEEVLKCIKEIRDLRDSLSYDIDGAVVKINSLSLRSSLGSTYKVPKWAIAYKYPPEEKETKILDIIYQVGRTGQITPLAIIKPVKVAGSTISKCTLHNFDFVKEKDVRVGDTVIISKAGDVIPELVKVVTTKRTGKEIVFKEPKVCPVCGEKLERLDKEVALRCTNSECDAQAFRAIIHFASRDAMEIDGMGDAVVDSLITLSLVKDVADIYSLEFKDALKIEGFQDRAARNLINAIEKSKTNTLDKLIFGLGIRHFGKKTAKTIADNIENIHVLETITKEELTSIKEVGSIMADSIISFFKKPKTREIIQRLETSGVNILGTKRVVLSENLKDEKVVITGSFDGYSRDDLVNLVELNSGNVTGTVSKNTSMIVVGESAGSKLKKAYSLGIKVYSLREFLELIKTK